jgi:hypothetical protein
MKRYLGSDVEGFIIGYYYTPGVEKFLREKHPGIRMMKSFEFEMKYEREKAPR